MRMFTPPDNPSAIVSFYHGLDHAELSRALAEEGVAITFQEDGRLLRAAVGCSTTATMWIGCWGDRRAGLAFHGINPRRW